MIYKNILHYACESGNLELVKYLVSLNELDINDKTVFTHIFFNTILYFLFYRILICILIMKLHQALHLTMIIMTLSIF